MRNLSINLNHEEDEETLTIIRFRLYRFQAQVLPELGDHFLFRHSFFFSFL